MIGLFRALFFGFWVSCLALVAFVVSFVFFVASFPRFFFLLWLLASFAAFVWNVYPGFADSWLCSAVLAFLAFWLLLPIVGLWLVGSSGRCGYGSIPINTIFRGMNIHLPAILMF